MNVTIRPYRPADAAQVVDVYRDAYEALRRSAGGSHPDAVVDRIQAMSDAALLDRVLRGYRLWVADDADDPDRLLGIGAMSDRSLDRVLRSGRSKSHYVRRGLQRGRGGKPLGTLLREATLGWARARGDRKVWGYSQPESRRWHEHFGATFHPEHDTYNPEHELTVSYYEIVLRPSPWNALRIEPLLFRLAKWLRGGKAPRSSR